jgi:hypothetical protein
MVRIKEVEPREDYTLFLTFTNGQKGIFDAKPFLDVGIYHDLLNKSLFQSVKVSEGKTVEWANGADICPDCIYEKTKII